MLKFLGPATRKSRAVAQTKMRSIIEHRDISFPEQAGNGSERAAESAVEKHRIFAAEEGCDFSLQFAVEIGHAGKHGRAAGAETVSR